MLTVDLGLGPPFSELSIEAAFRILPIAHQYDMQLLLRWCSQAVGKARLDLWPSAPIASSQVPMHPGLLQFLALADSKQCAPLVETCLSQLLCQQSDEAIHEAVASPHLRQIIDGLRPETKTSIICKMAGMPLGFQVLMIHVDTVCCMRVRLENACVSVLQRLTIINESSLRFLSYLTGTYPRDRQAAAGYFNQT